jgi:hypothetical protein
MPGGVRKSVDIGRLSDAVSRPGIDPRVWLTFARVEEVGFDSEQGVFADVAVLPEGDKETCLIASSYAGSGFGTFVPPKVGDIVLVAVPGGDPGSGPVIIARIFSGTAPPPSQFQDSSGEPEDATTDPTTVVEPQRTLKVVANDGANVRLEISGSGKVQVAATGSAQIEVTGESTIIVNSPDVRLGATAGTGVARVGDIVVSTVPPLVDSVTSAPIILNPVPAGIPGYTAVGQITSGASGVKA